jgi:hypothetical protein
MALCDGERKTSRAACNGTLYKCSQCGNTGCQQTKADGCSKQAFSVLQRCAQCGAVAQREALSDLKTDRAPRKTPSLI